MPTITLNNISVISWKSLTFIDGGNLSISRENSSYFVSDNFFHISPIEYTSPLSPISSHSVVFSGYSSFLHQSNWPPRYNWNIVENGVKHHKPTNLCNSVSITIKKWDEMGLSGEVYSIGLMWKKLSQPLNKTKLKQFFQNQSH
jgi:hypothetical protein